MSVQGILAKRMAEVEARQSSKKDAIAALFAQYPDIRAFLLDMKEAGFETKLEAFKWAIHGPLKTHTGYVATAGGLEIPPSSRPKASVGSGVSTSTGRRSRNGGTRAGGGKVSRG